MADDQRWPYPDRPGVPLEPEKSGEHWIQHKTTGRVFKLSWMSARSREPEGWAAWLLHEVAEHIYVAPVLTPAEIDAKIAAAVAEAVRAEREACAAIAKAEMNRWVPASSGRISAIKIEAAILARTQ